jgi:hypothetical protein
MHIDNEDRLTLYDAVGFYAKNNKHEGVKQ